MKIVIESIDHKDQRYETVGDWFWDEKGVLQIRVSRMSDRRYEWLAMLHEIVEALLCKHDGIDEECVTEFDKMFEIERARGDHGKEEEPGDSAPYRHQHSFATALERALSVMIGVDWKKYSEEVERL